MQSGHHQQLLSMLFTLVALLAVRPPQPPEETDPKELVGCIEGRGLKLGLALLGGPCVPSGEKSDCADAFGKPDPTLPAPTLFQLLLPPIIPVGCAFRGRRDTEAEEGCP